MLLPNNILRGFSFLYLSLYLIASFIPDSWLWGVHQLAFIPLPFRLLLVGISSIMIMLPLFPKLFTSIEELYNKINLTQSGYLILTGVIAIIAVLLFNLFRIATDIYGDSRTLLNAMRDHYYTLTDAFFAKEAESLTRFVHQTIATITGLPTQSAIAWGNILSGGVFVVILLLFIRSLKLPFLAKISFLVLTCSLAGMQLFFGYVEDYSYSFGIIILFLMLGWHTLEGRNWIWLMLILLIIGIRYHLVAVFMIPSMVYIFVWYQSKKKGKTSNIISPKNILIGIVGTLIIGLLLYVFYFKAYSYLTTEEKERTAKIFLPFFNPLPDPHRYALLSIGHFSDIIQILLYNISPGIILVLAISFILRKKIKWNEPRIIFYGLASFYSLLFCVTVNPLLSFVRDWDLLAFTGLPFLFFALSIIKSLSRKEEHKPILSQVACSSVGLALVYCVIFYVNTNPTLVHERVLQAGRATFKNYYRGSAYMINVAEGTIKDLRAQLDKRGETIQSLLPYSGAQDIEMANITSMAGKCALSIQDFISAEKYFNLSFQYDSLNATALKSIALCKLMQSDINGASTVIDYYNVQINEPDVDDSKTLLLAGFTNYIRYLNSVRTDTILIRNRLSSFYQAYTDTSR